MLRPKLPRGSHPELALRSRRPAWPAAPWTRRRGHKIAKTTPCKAGLARQPGLRWLFCQQRERAVPVFRRRGFHVVANAGFVELVERGERSAIVTLAAALDREKRTFP